jgi:hypothetical protein
VTNGRTATQTKVSAFPLPSAAAFAHNDVMANEPDQRKTLWQWAITPPQSYLLYLVALVVIFVGSFYAGTLKPKKTPAAEPPAAASTPSPPRNQG